MLATIAMHCACDRAFAALSVLLPATAEPNVVPAQSLLGTSQCWERAQTLWVRRYTHSLTRADRRPSEHGKVLQLLALA